MPLTIPWADLQLIKPGANDPRVDLRTGILHVDGGNAYNLRDWFDGPSGGIESHLHIPKNAHTFQYRDLNFEADANWKANPFAMSVETQGYASGEWTDDQLAEIKRIMLWSEPNLGIPLRKPTHWRDSGWGYHTMFPEWYPKAKSCPGKERIEQYHDLLVPWMALARENPKMAIEDLILNAVERCRLAENRLEEQIKLLLTPEQRELARKRSDAYAKANPIRKG
jgi:hypothetical protein